MLAAFASTEITPPIGTGIIGWLRPIPSTAVADPLFARIGILQQDGEALAVFSLDVLSFRWSSTNELRQRIAARYGFPADRIMVGATHNHAGPAVNGAGEGGRDDAFLATVLDKLVDLFGEAHAKLEPAQIGLGHGYEWRIAKNRRVVYRDGHTRCHGRFTDPAALYIEGPIDPEVGVIAVQALDGRPLGVWVNHTCHPTHHGSDSILSAGWPGVFAKSMLAAGWPVASFLQGAAGDIHYADPRGLENPSMEQLGEFLAETALRVIRRARLPSRVSLGGAQTTIQPAVPPAECRGDCRHDPWRQRFVDPAIYDRQIARLLQRIADRGTQPAGAGAAPGRLDAWSASRPSTSARWACSSRCAAGRATRWWSLRQRHGRLCADRRGDGAGGYETTFAGSSRLAPKCGQHAG